MADPVALAAEILQDVNLIVDLYAKVSANIAAAKELVSTNTDASVAQQIADAKAKLATIQVQAAQADADFDAALAAVQG